MLFQIILCFLSINAGDSNHSIVIMQNLMERLRPLVGSKAGTTVFSGNWVKTRGWVTTFNSVSAFQDPSYFSHSLKSSLFCFRCIEWMDCCCAGTENNQNGGEELLLPFSQVIPCRDTICPHPRASSCELLAQLPCSVPLNSGYSIDIYHLHVPPSLPLSFSQLFSVEQGLYTDIAIKWTQVATLLQWHGFNRTGCE